MKSSAPTLLRWGVAFVLFYGAVLSLLSPARTLIHIPALLTALVPGKSLLVVFSVYELALSGMLFWGKKMYWSSLLAAITFIIIVIMDFGVIAIAFPYIGLTLAALALFDMSRVSHTSINNNDTDE